MRRLLAFVVLAIVAWVAAACQPQGAASQPLGFPVSVTRFTPAAVSVLPPAVEWTAVPGEKEWKYRGVQIPEVEGVEFTHQNSGVNIKVSHVDGKVKIFVNGEEKDVATDEKNVGWNVSFFYSKWINFVLRWKARLNPINPFPM